MSLMKHAVVPLCSGRESAYRLTCGEEALCKVGRHAHQVLHDLLVAIEAQPDTSATSEVCTRAAYWNIAQQEILA